MCWENTQSYRYEIVSDIVSQARVRLWKTEPELVLRKQWRSAAVVKI